MQKYESIQNYINRAEAQRSLYLAELLASATFATWNGIKRAAGAVLSIARAKSRTNVFTFDA